METDASYITNLAILDEFLYASDFYLGFRIFKISDLNILSEIGRDEAGGSPLGFQVVDEFAFVASQIRGIQIIEVQFEGSQIQDTKTTNQIEGTKPSDNRTQIEAEIALLSVLVLSLYTRGREKKRL
ncbi:MAG: hypothetical protein EAX86_06450 [Candidatus Heimdallarchaeota archaeon]|nr:hypothetical protein [Candidatus Heimdallarchaeota archaeon]